MNIVIAENSTPTTMVQNIMAPEVSEHSKFTIILTRWWTTARPFRKDGPVEVVELWEGDVLRCHTEKWCTRRYSAHDEYIETIERHNIHDQLGVHRVNGVIHVFNNVPCPLHRDDGPAVIEIRNMGSGGSAGSTIMVRRAEWKRKGMSCRYNGASLDQETYQVGADGTKIKINHVYEFSYLGDPTRNTQEVIYTDGFPTSVNIRDPYNCGYIDRVIDDPYVIHQVIENPFRSYWHDQ